MRDTPAKGLIPRSGLFILIAVFVLVLLGFAIYDLTKSKSPDKSKSKDNPAQPMVAVKVGPPPSPGDVTEIARSQTQKGEQIANQPVNLNANPVHDDKASGGKIAPSADGSTRARPGMPLRIGANQPVGTGDLPVGESANDQRDAAAAVSSIFSLTGAGDGLASSIERTGLPGSAAAARAVSPIQRQIDELTKGQPNSSGAPDPTTQLSKAIAGMQANQSATRPGKDQSWLMEVSSLKEAEAVYAKTPATPWMVFQGTRVPIVTREAVNSDLPGQVTALSTSPVYDSINQCAVMIPAGTKFIGTYSADIRPGQSRLLLAYRRMIFPDGRSVELDGAQAVDQRGAAGAEGDVNNHFLQMFGYGFAVALLSNSATGGSGVTVTQPNGASTTTTVAGQVLADIGTRVMTRNATIPPTISLDVGSRMFVTIVRDIALTPTSRNQCK